MSGLEVLGLIATFCTASSFAPQVWRTWKTRDVSGISLSMFCLMTFGLALWLIYGIYRDDIPLIVANAIMVVLSGAILAMKLLFTQKT